MNKTIVHINDFNIWLPIGLKQVMDTPVRDSYQDFLQNDTSLVRRHLTCLTTLIPKYLSPTTTRVLHVFGGVGATAQVIDSVVKARNVEHVFWERDPVLVEYLRATYPTNLTYHVEDSYQSLLDCNLEWLEEFDAIMFDPSVGTIKTPLIKECWAKMAAAHPDLIWLSDTACAKIHINARFYQKDFGQSVIPTAEGYLDAYNHWLIRNTGYSIADAMREAAETYCIILPGEHQSPDPIPYV